MTTSAPSDAILDRLVLAGVPPRHRDASFDGFDARPGTDDMLAAAGQWADERDLGSYHGLVLLGPPGAGKTHVMVAALRHRLERWQELPPPITPADHVWFGRIRHVHFEVVPLLLDRLRAAIRYEGTDTEEHFAHLRDECPLLVLDDLGREKVTDWVAERLYVLAESRYGRLLPTCATSNLSLDELSANGYGPLVSRLSETSEFVSTTATDYRPTKGKEGRS